MAVQDDRRELAQLELFGLEKPGDSGRSGVDAVLQLEDGREIQFELKSTTDGSVTTARDFGVDHINRWRGMHFLISKFSKSGYAIEYSLYGGPLDMEPWLASKEAYIRPDYLISELAPQKLELEDLYKVLGKKEMYDLADARSIHKLQYGMKKYIERMDMKGGYSELRMLEILKDRCEYVLQRGATLNNPHISKKVLENWDRITSDHAIELRKSVTRYFERA